MVQLGLKAQPNRCSDLIVACQKLASIWNPNDYADSYLFGCLSLFPPGNEDVHYQPIPNKIQTNAFHGKYQLQIAGRPSILQDARPTRVRHSNKTNQNWWDSKRTLNQVSEFLHATLEFFSADSLIIVRIKDLRETFGSNTDVFYATCFFSRHGTAWGTWK